MGLFSSNHPKTAYVPPSNGGRPTLLGDPNVALAADPGSATPPPRTAVVRNLPGLGNTYLDSEFSPKVDAFIENARRQGVNLEFEQAYRSPQQNQALIDRPNDHGVVYPVAPNSLHMAGLAVDVKRYLDQDNATKAIIRDAAEKAKLEWGGTFNPPDHVHFYFDPAPGADRTPLISNFSDQVRRLSSAPAQVPR
jgi:hypothetical protein